MSGGARDAVGIAPHTLVKRRYLPTAPRPHAPRRHIHEIDIVRILTFASVIGVHTISDTAGANDVGLHVVLALLHFTREPFFWITGFVLMWSYFNKPVPMRKFWPRRFLLVGVPYLVWSLVYATIGDVTAAHRPSLGRFVVDYLIDIGTGNAWYHLYFLLVTMQIYLLVPAIAWLVKATRRHHVTLLVVAALVQMALMAWYHYGTGVLPGFLAYDKQYVFGYCFFILAGAVCADHGDGFFAWVAAHRGRIGLIVLGCAAVYLAVFAIEAASGSSLYAAGSPMQPAMVVWGIGAGLGFAAIGSLWAERRRTGTLLALAVDTATDRSFGIFLAHPLFIWAMLSVAGGWFPRTLPNPWLTILVYAVAVLGAVGLTEVLRRTPMTLWFTGRPRRRASVRRAEPQPRHPYPQPR